MFAPRRGVGTRVWELSPIMVMAQARTIGTQVDPSDSSHRQLIPIQIALGVLARKRAKRCCALINSIVLTADLSVLNGTELGAHHALFISFLLFLSKRVPRSLVVLGY
ncbi:unnamed protein product [Caenorhabditis auriculariae]|uniref:Uncharacterized protein n=1 Tax=Caenorhabditis auriculariae TaxID=2777116 RepID=A0A8S1H6G9_9PELO|nr:unnamed protein product [Caenorhabditis auriculariae]